MSSWARQLVLMLTSLLLLPYLLSRLGDTGYGIYVIVGSFVSMLGTIDLGLAASVTRFTARDEASGDHERLLETTSAALVVMGAIGLLGLLIATVAIPVLPSVFAIPQELFWDMAGLTGLMGLSFALRFAFIPVKAIIVGAKRQDMVNVLGSIQVLLRAGFIVLLFELFAARLVYVGLATAGSQMLMFLSTAALARYRVLGRPFFRIGRVGRHAFGRLASYSVLNAFAVLGGLLVDQGLNVTIGICLGPGMVAAFAAPLKAGALIRALVTGLASPLIPFAGHDWAKTGGAKLGWWLFRVSRLCSLIVFGIGVPASIMAGPLLTFWIGEDYTWTAAVLILVVMAGGSRGVMSTGYFLIVGGGRIGTLAIMSLAMSAFALAVPVVDHGVNGGGLLRFVSLACGVLLLKHVIVLPSVFCRQFQVSLARYLRETYVRSLAVAAVPAAVLTGLVYLRPPRNLAELFGYAVGFALIYAAFAWVGGLNRQDRELAKGLFRRVGARGRGACETGRHQAAGRQSRNGREDDGCDE